MKQLLFVFILCGLFVRLSFAQNTFTFEGFILEYDAGGKVLEGVSVELLNSSTKISGTTNSSGFFSLEGVPEGRQRVELKKEGYESAVFPFEINNQNASKAFYFDLVKETPKTLSLKDKLNTSITTASKNAETLLDAPATVYIITAKDIEERGYMSLSEVLEDIPEVEIQDRTEPNTYNVISIRGIPGNEKFLVLLDGMRVSSMATTAHPIDKNFLIRYAKRIEIVLGPASALYGADAFSGVINIITYSGKELKGGKVTGSYGMYNTTENSAIVGFRKGRVSFVLSGSYYYSDEAFMPNFYPNEYAWYTEQYAQNGNVLIPFSTDTVNINIDPFDMKRQAYFFNGSMRWKGLELGVVHNHQTSSAAIANRSEYAPPVAQGVFGVSLTNAYLKHNLRSRSKKWSLASSLNWNHYELNTFSSFYNVFTSFDRGYKYAFNHNVRLRETFNINLHEKHKLLVGASYQFTRALPKTGDLPSEFQRGQTAEEQNLYYIGTNITDTSGDSLTILQDLYYFNQQNIGAFVQYQGNFNDKLLLTIGARLDLNRVGTINDLEDAEPSAALTFNPRLGLVYKPIEQLRIKAFYGEAFLAPSPEKRLTHFGSFVANTDSLGTVTSFSSGFWHLTNPDLNPEKVRSAELSVSYVVDNLVLGLGGYINDLDNLVSNEITFGETFQGVEVAVVERSVNASTALTYGGTAQVDYQHFFNANRDVMLGGYGVYSFSDGFINDSLRLTYSAHHTIKAGIRFKYKSFHLNVSSLFRTASVNDGFPNDQGGITQVGNSPYVTFNLFARYTFIQKRNLNVSMFVKVRNLLDARYYHPTTNSFAHFDAAPQDPIRILAGVSFSLRR